MRQAYIAREYETCYKYIEKAYLEMDKAERAKIDINLEFKNEINHLNCYANRLHKSCPWYSPKLNSSIKQIDELIKELQNAVSVFSDDYTACKDIIRRINSEITMAVRYGAGVRKLKKFNEICDRFSSPQKITLYLERNEFYRQIVQAYRLKDYCSCNELIDKSYSNFYISLNEGVSEKDIKMAIKRIELYKNFIKELNVSIHDDPIV